MKKLRYSAGVKAIVIILLEFFSVVLVLFIVLLTVLMKRDMLDISDLNKKPFSESAYFDVLFREGVSEIFQFVSLKKEFETAGTYNPEKEVDINEYAKAGNAYSRVGSVADEKNDFRYRLEDLEDWSKDYKMLDCKVETVFTTMEDGTMIQRQTIFLDNKVVRDSGINVQELSDLSPKLQEMVIDRVLHYYGGDYENELTSSELDISTGINQGMDSGSEIEGNDDAGLLEEEALLEAAIDKAVNGNLFDLEVDELRVLLKDLELSSMGREQEESFVQEKYLPVSGNSILKSFLSDSITLEQMQETHNALEYTLIKIGEKLNTYRRFVNKYDKSDKNLSYWIYSEGQTQPLSNISNVGNGEELISFGKRQGRFFYFNERESRLDTNVDGMEDLYFDSLKNIYTGKNLVIMVAVNTTFLYEDSFSIAKAEYDKLQPWVIVSLVISGISIMACLFCFVFLSIASGRKISDDQIHLCWFDKIKTEILMVAALFVGIGIFALYAKAASQFETKECTGIMILAGGITFTTMGVFLIVYLSFVRRIKAGVMWSGSFTFWLGKSISDIVKSRQSITKVMILFALHFLVCLLIGAFGYWSYGRLGYMPALLLFLLFSCMEGNVFFREGIQRNIIMKGIKKIVGGDLDHVIDTSKLDGYNKGLGETLNTIGEGLYHAIEDSMKSERLKADLITNVSHDIKTPLTSIINYVDLIKREDIPNERVQNYVKILDAKSQRLKQLTEDLVEASKVSSGNITLQIDRINLVELVYQTGGEFNEKFEERGLKEVAKLPGKPVIILADGRRIWRVIENLYDNVAKYAMKNTRVYVDMKVLNDTAFFSIKNISEQALNIDASELTERFIRGDVSRSTEGSGLGLSIAKNLTQMMGGTFDTYLDGDLFKVTISFPSVKEDQARLEEKKESF